MEAPIINPLRFYDTAPNWSSIWPTLDNIEQRKQYFEGVYPGLFYKDFVEGENIKLQFKSNSLDVLSVYKWDAITNAFIINQTLIPAYITPPGWVGENIIYFSFTLTSGVYYVKFDDGYTSDKFVVHSELSIKKKLIRINYYNSENDYGAIFENNDVIVFSPVTFFTGRLDSGAPENEISSFRSDRGELVKLRSTPVRIQTLQLCDVHVSYIDNINLIFSCDYLNINGVEYQNSEPPITNFSENLDICDIEIKLIMKNNSYFYKKS